jgi:aminomethyltransferase
MMPRQTAFHARTSVCCQSQSWQEWSGFLSANSYELEHVHEYHAARTASAVFDISPLYKYHVHGRGAARLLDRVLTRDASKLAVGQVAYTNWCDDEGKIIDDGTVTRLGPERFRLTAAIPTLDWLQDNDLGIGAAIEDVSEDLAGLSVQGPTSRALLQGICDAELGGLRYFRQLETKLGGVPVSISRGGYTGDLGFELFCDPVHAERLWDAVTEAGRAFNLRPAGNIAQDMLRIEAGLLLIDVDFTSSKRTLFEVQKSTPLELGLAWTVALGKDYFVGRDALRAEKARGSRWKTIGLVLDVVALEKVYAGYGMPLHLPDRSWNDAVPIYADAARRDHAGRASSGTWSPILKNYVAIARVRPELGEPGTRVYVEETVEGRRHEVPASVVKLPFYDPPQKRG